MADPNEYTISQLPDGGPVQSGDLTEISRPGSPPKSYRVDLGQKADAGWTLAWQADVDDTIATGGTSQEALAAGADRVAWEIEADPTNADYLYFGLGTAAVVGTGKALGPGMSHGAYFPLAAADKLAINVISATTGAAFTIRQKVIS